MENKITEEEIARQLATLINQNISKKQNDDNKWKNHYFEIIEELEHEIKFSEDNILDYKEDKLTFNLIEQEGYLRGLKRMLRSFKDRETYL